MIANACQPAAKILRRIKPKLRRTLKASNTPHAYESSENTAMASPTLDIPAPANTTAAATALNNRRTQPRQADTPHDDHDNKVMSIAEALTEKTRAGSIRWRRAGRNSFQTVVNDVTVVVTESRENPLAYHRTHTMEILNEHGDSIVLVSTKQRTNVDQTRRLERLHASARSSDLHSRAVLETLLQRLNDG